MLIILYFKSQRYLQRTSDKFMINLGTLTSFRLPNVFPESTSRLQGTILQLYLILLTDDFVRNIKIYYLGLTSNKTPQETAFDLLCGFY